MGTHKNTDFLNISRVIIVSVFTHICTVLIFYRLLRLIEITMCGVLIGPFFHYAHWSVSQFVV